jgi:cation:H+ antiporter
VIWLEFVISAALIVVAAMKLAECADAIALRTKLGGMFVGTLLLAGATSLPELFTTLHSINQGVPALAAGNIFGSSMFNMLILAMLDLSNPRTRILRRVAVNHALSASVAVLLTGTAVLFVLADIGAQIGWVGLDSIMLVGMYWLGMALVYGKNRLRGESAEVPPANVEGVLGLAPAVLCFSGATVVLVMVTPWLVHSSVGIAEITGLSTGFIGAALVAVVTSLPEVVTAVAAVRIGAHDLAVGNLFGSNIFNIFALGSTDIFYFQGRFLGSVDPTLALAGLAGLLLTSLGLVGTLAQVERRLLFVEVDALLIFMGYLGAMLLLYSRGVVG